MQRRTFLQGLTAGAAALRAERGPAGSPLRERATARNLLYGAAGSYPALSNDFEYAAAFARECAIVVPENALKWKALRPAPDRFDFEQADWLANFARTHGMKFRGHTLVWHQALPDWFAGTVTRSNARDTLEQHIRTVAGHYKGRIHSWDVVNEAVLPTDRRDDGLRQTPWLELLGPEYLEIACSAAAAADPGAMLVYNDYGLDYDDPVQEAKRLDVLAQLRRLKRAGIPLHAFGMQAHLSAGNRRFRPEVLQRFLGEVAQLGLKILITELDVADKGLADDIVSRDREVAKTYESYLSAALEEPAVIAVLTWGLSDRYTWLASHARRKDGVAVRPLPLDRELGRKPAWRAIAAALDAAQPRR